MEQPVTVTVTDNWVQTQEDLRRRIATIEFELIEQRQILSQNAATGTVTGSQAKQMDENANLQLQLQEQEPLLEIQPLPVRGSVTQLQDLDRERELCLRQLEDELADIKALCKELSSMSIPETDEQPIRNQSQSENSTIAIVNVTSDTSPCQQQEHRRQKRFSALSIVIDEDTFHNGVDEVKEQKNRPQWCKLSPESPIFQILVCCVLLSGVIALILILNYVR